MTLVPFVGSSRFANLKTANTAHAGHSTGTGFLRRRLMGLDQVAARVGEDGDTDGLHVVITMLRAFSRRDRRTFLISLRGG